MYRLRSQLAILLATAGPLPLILLHCGGDHPNPVADAGDATAADATAGDAVSPDVSSDDSTGDAATPDATAADDRPNTDALNDNTGSDTAEAGEGAADASDAGAEATVDATPCSVDAGDDGSSCGATTTCCGGWCVNTSTDPRNCGVCGNACSSTQFCTGVACDDAIFKNVCGNPKATVVFDPFGPDNAAGNGIGTALSMGCMPAVAVYVADQDSGTAQDPASGRPLTGPGDTLVAAGGSHGQASVGYMDGNGLTTIYLGADGTNTWFQNRKTKTNVIFAPNTSLTIHHDYFVLQLSIEPTSGTLCFFGIGLLAPGTAAATYYFQNIMMPALSTYGQAWYVYEWTDTDMSGTPTAGDTFTVVANGS